VCVLFDKLNHLATEIIRLYFGEGRSMSLIVLFQHLFVLSYYHDPLELPLFIKLAQFLVIS
jgi:hypothetical protein